MFIVFTEYFGYGLISHHNLILLILNSKKVVIECIHGLMSQVLKDQLANKVKNDSN
jgi:hypothetical protein